jgi:hypothetical protein
MAEEALLEQVLGAAAGSARMAAVATEDMIRARRHPDDWLDAWDPAYIRTGARSSLSRYRTVPASPENMKRALELDAALLVYPGGDHETYRPTWESGRIDFAGRRGFARLAIEHGCPIVPVVAIGGQGPGAAAAARPAAAGERSSPPRWRPRSARAPP